MSDATAFDLLDEDWIARDPVLAPVLPLVLSRGAGLDWHKAGTFAHHLVGVARSLALWRQPPEVRLLGLLHSVYGNAHVDIVKFDPATERGRLRDAVGERAEHLVHLFCTASRTQFVQRVLAGGIEADGSVRTDAHTIAADDTAAFLVVLMADTVEQWFSWQDDIYSRFPHTPQRPQAAHWAASLWPGPMRPTARMVGQTSRFGRALQQHPALAGRLPLPPVFDHCTHALAEDDEAAAAALYWSVVQQQHPLLDADAATAQLVQASRLNPWVAEPHTLLAQLHLAHGRWADALASADRALALLAQWGNAWDKRVAWNAWVAWTRILQQHARAGHWPDRIDKLNNVALR